MGQLYTISAGVTIERRVWAPCMGFRGDDQFWTGSDCAGGSNWRFTLGKRKKKSHQTLMGNIATTREMASNCLNESSSLTKRSGMKKVSNGRNAIMYRQKQSATVAHESAALRAHGFN